MSSFVFPEIVPKETRAAFAGRRKKAINQWNDSLELEEGDPVVYCGRVVRFRRSLHIERHRPSLLRIPMQVEIRDLEEREAKENQKRLDLDAIHALRKHPSVILAESVRWLIEDDAIAVAHCLSTEEWQALHDKLAKADGTK